MGSVVKPPEIGGAGKLADKPPFAKRKVWEIGWAGAPVSRRRSSSYGGQAFTGCGGRPEIGVWFHGTPSVVGVSRRDSKGRNRSPSAIGKLWLTARAMPEEGDGKFLRQRNLGRFLVAVVVCGWPAPAASHGDWRSRGERSGNLGGMWGSKVVARSNSRALAARRASS